MTKEQPIFKERSKDVTKSRMLNVIPTPPIDKIELLNAIRKILDNR